MRLKACRLQISASAMPLKWASSGRFFDYICKTDYHFGYNCTTPKLIAHVARAFDNFSLMKSKREIGVVRLKEKIERAFSDVLYPGDENMIIPAAFWGTEAHELSMHLQGKDWKDLKPLENYSSIISSEQSGDYYFSHQDTLLFLTPQAFRFFLPAFMTACLAFDEAFMISTTTVFCLTSHPENVSYEANIYMPRMALMSAEQLEVIAEFLRYVYSYHSG